MADVEDRRRRCNLRIDGVTERKGETREQCEDETQNIFKEQLGLESNEIERAHCSKGYTSSNKPRTIICKLSSYKQRRKYLSTWERR